MLSEFNVEAEVNQPSRPANFRTLIGVCVDDVVLQQNKAELTGLYAIARSELKDKYKLLVKKTRSYGFALQKNASDKKPLLKFIVNIKRTFSDGCSHLKTHS